MISRENILHLEARQKIYDFIKKNPGLHQREISRRMNIPKSTLLYHIRFLIKLNLIDESNGCKNKYYCPSGKMGAKEKQILNLFRKKIPCRIFLHMIFSLSFSQIELSRELDLPYTTVVRNIKKMKKIGLIEEAPTAKGRVYPFPHADKIYVEMKSVKSEKFYRRTSGEMVDRAWTVLIAHKDDLVNKELIQAYIDYAIGLNVGWMKSDGNFIEEYKSIKKKVDISKRIRTIDHQFDSIINVFNDIIRPPFCA